MKKRLKGFYLVITSIVIALLHLPFAFAKSAVSATRAFASKDNIPVKPAVLPGAAPMPTMRSVYDSLHLDLAGLSQQAFDYAKKGFDKLMSQGMLQNDSIISIADFSQPSTQKRLYVVDLKNYKVLFNTHVAHGRNTGREWATYFSNQPSSYKSSPGFYITGQTYNGGNGYSLKLEGMEKGINDNAYERAIVMHGADYVNAAFAAQNGYLGRSQGCPAVPVALARPIINTIKDGSCLFIYNPNYVKNSSLLKG
jgi:hypothetical protein